MSTVFTLYFAVGFIDKQMFEKALWSVQTHSYACANNEWQLFEDIRKLITV
jgi:hypothetical protein